MKKLLYIPILLFMFSCSNVTISFENDVSLIELKRELISKFGEAAYYTNISITNSDYGSFVGVTQTDDPKSLKMTGWNYVNGNWNQTTDVTLELPSNANVEDFMFQLDKIIDFDIMGRVVQESKNKIVNEKGIKDIKVENIFIKAPRNGDLKEMKYFITISPKAGGTDFNFWYNMDGTLDKFDY